MQDSNVCPPLSYTSKTTVTWMEEYLIAQEKKKEILQSRWDEFLQNVV